MTRKQANWRPVPDWLTASATWWAMGGQEMKLLIAIYIAAGRHGEDQLPAEPARLRGLVAMDVRPNRLGRLLDGLAEGGFITVNGGRIGLVWTLAEHNRLLDEMSVGGRAANEDRTDPGPTADDDAAELSASGPHLVRGSSAVRPHEVNDSEEVPDPLSCARVTTRGEEKRGEERKETPCAREAHESAGAREAPRQPPDPRAPPSPPRPCLGLVREDCRDHARRWLDRLGLELTTDRSAGAVDGPVVGGIRMQPPRARRRPTVWDQARSSPAALEADHADRLAELAEGDPEAFRDAVDRHLEDTRGWSGNPLAWLTRGVEFAREDLNARGGRGRGRRPTTTGVECGPPPLEEMPEPLDGPMTAAELRLLGGLHA